MKITRSFALVLIKLPSDFGDLLNLDTFGKTFVSF